MKKTAWLIALALLGTGSIGACKLASGYDPKAYPSGSRAAADPETEPLPPAPKTTIPDPRSAGAAEAAATPSQAPPASSASAATSSAASAPSAPSASAAAASPAGSAKPKPSTAATPASPAPAAGAECGTKENPCPMQRFMRGQMASASTGDALNAAFTRVAAMSPNGGWQWAAIAKKGAELAKSGDVPAAKKQCAACHGAYRDSYKQQYRARKI